MDLTRDYGVGTKSGAVSLLNYAIEVRSFAITDFLYLPKILVQILPNS